MTPQLHNYDPESGKLIEQGMKEPDSQWYAIYEMDEYWKDLDIYRADLTRRRSEGIPYSDELKQEIEAGRVKREGLDVTDFKLQFQYKDSNGVWQDSYSINRPYYESINYETRYIALPLTAGQQAEVAGESVNSFAENIRKIRNYFGEHDKTAFEHWAFSYLNTLLNSTKELPTVSEPIGGWKEKGLDTLASELEKVIFIRPYNLQSIESAAARLIWKIQNPEA